MIWDLPIQVRLTILFVFIPLLDRCCKLVLGHRIIHRSLKYHLKYFNKFFYYYGWYLVLKIFILVSWFKIIGSLGVFYDNEEYDYVLLLLLLGYFSVGYLFSLTYMKFGYRVIKWLSVITLVIGLFMSFYHISYLININGFAFLYNDFIWQPLLGLAIIYRFRMEIIIRS